MRRSAELWVLVLIYGSGALVMTAGSLLYLWPAGEPMLATDILYGVLGLLVGSALGVGTALLLGRRRVARTLLDAATLGFVVTQMWVALEEAWPHLDGDPMVVALMGTMLVLGLPVYALPSLLLRVEEIDQTLQPTATHDHGPMVVRTLTALFAGLGALMVLAVARFAFGMWGDPQALFGPALFLIPVALAQLALAAIILSAALGLVWRVDRDRRTLLTLCRLNLGLWTLLAVFGTLLGVFFAGSMALLAVPVMVPYLALAAVPIQLLQSNTVQRQMTDNWQFNAGK